jgi:hypothetical protein
LHFSYTVFGLDIHSNLALPGVPLADAPDAGKHRSDPARFSLTKSHDVTFHLGVAPYSDAEIRPREKELVYASAYLDENENPVLRIWKAADETYLRLDYCDGTRFWLNRSRQQLWAIWPEHLTLENALCYLLGPVFGLLLRLRGVTCLHASAVVIDNWGVVFVGAEGAGKSTTAAAFAKQGHAVLSDDIVALAPPVSASALPATPGHRAANSQVQEAVAPEQFFRVLPAYPHLCLWPDSVKMLYGPGEPLPRISPEWDKRRLSLGTAGTRFETRALPLGAVYLFSARGPDPAPSVQAARGQSSLVSLLANTYANNLLDRTMRAEEFAVLDRLVARVPIRVLSPHEDPARLEQLCDCIREDFRSLQPSPQESLASLPKS